MRWIKKMIATFFDGLDELYHHAKFWEDLKHAPAVDPKIWWFLVFFCLFFIILRVRSTVRSRGA